MYFTFLKQLSFWDSLALILEEEFAIWDQGLKNMYPDTKIQERIVLERDETHPDQSFIEVVSAFVKFRFSMKATKIWRNPSSSRFCHNT